MRGDGHGVEQAAGPLAVVCLPPPRLGIVVLGFQLLFRPADVRGGGHLQIGLDLVQGLAGGVGERHREGGPGAVRGQLGRQPVDGHAHLVGLERAGAAMGVVGGPGHIGLLLGGLPGGPVGLLLLLRGVPGVVLGARAAGLGVVRVGRSATVRRGVRRRLGRFRGVGGAGSRGRAGAGVRYRIRGERGGGGGQYGGGRYHGGRCGGRQGAAELHPADLSVPKCRLGGTGWRASARAVRDPWSAGARGSGPYAHTRART